MDSVLLRCPRREPGRACPWHFGIALIVLAQLAFSVPASAVVVEVTPWGAPVITYFPPNSPPPGLADTLADATPEVNALGGMFAKYSWDPATNKFVVDSLTAITLDGHTKIRLPSNVDTILREHENGHDRLNRYEFEQRAKKKMETALDGFEGMEFTGVGANDSLRKLDARKKARAELERRMGNAVSSILEQMDVLGATFDDYTNHGTSTTCDTPQGEAKAKEGGSEAPEEDEEPLERDDLEPGGGVGSGAEVLFDETTQRLVLAGSGLIEWVGLPPDPIVGRGVVLVDSFVPIGPLGNGTTLLSDTRLRIDDPVTGTTLLNGYLLRAIYRPSNVAGFAGMIEAYLDLLPAWAGGTDNTIGSLFLDLMQASADQGDWTMVWIYSQAPLFDPLGFCLVPPGGVPVAPTIGVARRPPVAVGNPPGAARPGLTVSPQPGHGTVHFSWQPVGRPVDLEVYDLSGARRQVVRLEGSRGDWTWTGRDANGQPVQAGVYFVRLRGGGADLRSRVVIVR